MSEGWHGYQLHPSLTRRVTKVRNSYEFTQQVGKFSSAARLIVLLREEGPQLPRPHADTVKGSRHSNMKELRIQSGGKPLRGFFAFDPQRSAILLIGGDKTGDKRFYTRVIPLADDLFDKHLEELKKKGTN